MDYGIPTNWSEKDETFPLRNGQLFVLECSYSFRLPPLFQYNFTEHPKKEDEEMRVSWY